MIQLVNSHNIYSKCHLAIFYLQLTSLRYTLYTVNFTWLYFTFSRHNLAILYIQSTSLINNSPHYHFYIAFDIIFFSALPLVKALLEAIVNCQYLVFTCYIPIYWWFFGHFLTLYIQKSFFVPNMKSTHFDFVFTTIIVDLFLLLNARFNVVQFASTVFPLPLPFDVSSLSDALAVVCLIKLFEADPGIFVTSFVAFYLQPNFLWFMYIFSWF